MKKEKPKVKKPKLGRPTKFTQELADFICEKVSTNTCGIRKICAMYEGMPNPDTIHVWRLKNQLFSEQYAQAKRMQADLLAEECLDISDDSTRDFIEDGGTHESFNSEHVQRSRLRIDTRKWLASKLVPKVYGDRTINETKVTVIKHEDALKELE